MDVIVIDSKVEEINNIINKELWLYFEVVECNVGLLKIWGGIDLSYPDVYDIEIIFKDIFFTSLILLWESKPNNSILKFYPYGTAELNNKFSLEEGHHIFEFTSCDYPNSNFYIGAGSIDFVINPNGSFSGELSK